MLAAGAGRRLGYPKAALQLRGRWMLPRLLHALRAGGAARVILVLSADARQAIAAFGGHGADEVVENPAPERGRGSSLACGLAALPAAPEALLIHPCDVPLLQPSAVAHLLAAWRRAAARERLLARLVTPTGRGGHPLLVGGQRIEDLRRLQPGQSLRELLHADPAHRLDVRLEGDPGPFLDVDTPEQLAFLENL